MQECVTTAPRRTLVLRGTEASGVPQPLFGQDEEEPGALKRLPKWDPAYTMAAEGQQGMFWRDISDRDRIDRIRRRSHVEVVVSARAALAASDGVHGSDEEPDDGSPSKLPVASAPEARVPGRGTHP